MKAPAKSPRVPSARTHPDAALDVTTASSTPGDVEVPDAPEATVRLQRVKIKALERELESVVKYVCHLALLCLENFTPPIFTILCPIVTV